MYTCCNPITGYNHYPPCNPFKYRGSLYWDELAPLLKRNATIWSMIRINYYPKLFDDMVTVMDWYLPELALRTGNWRPDRGEGQGNYHLGAEANAVVVNMAWLGGECPMESIPGKLKKDQFGRDTTVIEKRPARGVVEGVRIALGLGSIRQSVEVGLLLNDYGMISREWGRE